MYYYRESAIIIIIYVIMRNSFFFLTTELHAETRVYATAPFGRRSGRVRERERGERESFVERRS